MMLFKTLSLFWFVVSVLSFPPQTTRTDASDLMIPNVTLDGRKDCGVREFLANRVVGSCDFVLPIDSNKYYDLYPSTLCFGVYDTLYELCKYQNLSSLEMPQYQIISFCKRANKSLINYNFKHGKQVFQEWTPHLRATLGSEANCTEMCAHAAEVNPMCAVIVTALERLPVVMAAASQPQSNVTQSLNAKANTPSAFQKQPSPSTKSASEPVKVKPPVAADPAPGPELDVKPDLGATRPQADKAVPQAEAVKPEQETKLEKPDQSPSEPKLDNPDMMDPAMLGPENMEDDDGPGPDAQPDPPVDQQADQVLPKDPVNDPKVPDDEAPGKQDNSMSFGEAPYLSISKDDSEETNMVTYFVLMTGGALLFYIAFHNKNKLLALALEGRRAGRRGGRHSSAAYSKLHSNLEETIASGPTSPSATHVLY